MNDRRTIIALLIIGLILLLMPTYMRLIYGPEETTGPVMTSPADSSAGEMAPGGVPEETATQAGEIPVAPPPEEARRSVLESEQYMGAGEADEGDRSIVVVTPLYRATLHTRGAVFTRWRLSGHQRENEPPIRMLPPGTRGPVLEVPVGDARVNALTLAFSTDAPDTIRIDSGESTSVELTAAVDSERTVTRQITFAGDHYSVDIRDGFSGFETTPMNDAYRLYWVGGLSFTEENTDPNRGRREDLQYSGFFGSQGGDVQKTRLKQEHVEEQLFGSVEWIALRTKYFTAALIPRDGAFRTVRMIGEAGESGPPQMEVIADRKLDSAEQQAIGTTLYLGPIDFNLLREYDVGLEGMMDFGFSIIRPIAKFVLTLFTFMHGYIPNYGLVLIIFSILIKILVFPLTRKSYESMHAMQELTPRMQEIREKYKDDPEKMNKKIMNLYKENKVNPLGGCFPLLLQMPIFWALFIVFRTTIELRGAPFVLWIHDLSLKDPYMVLPALMSLTMLLQQRAQLKNPQQRTMALMMPIMFFFLFKGFPSGLVLYWTLFNILSIVQTELVHKKTAPAGGDGTGASGKEKSLPRGPAPKGSIAAPAGGRKKKKR